MSDVDKPFTKHDGGKAPLSILFDQFQALCGVARVLAYGVRKYHRKNWAKVPDPERYSDAALRHIGAYIAGEVVDAESGESHLDHAICCLLFLSELQKRTP